MSWHAKAIRRYKLPKHVEPNSFEICIFNVANVSQELHIIDVNINNILVQIVDIFIYLNSIYSVVSL